MKGREPMRKALVLGILPAFLWLGCSDSTTDPPVENVGFVKYVGDFECDDLDGDQAVFFHDPDTGAGWFGWVPSNGGSGTYVMRPIQGLEFTVTFSEVYGADKAGETETLTFAMSGALSEDGDTISGTGTVTRQGSGAVEQCAFSFTRE
jgi:hypothetical protein